MERRDARRSAIDGQRVALQAEQVDLAALEQAWIRGAMRRVAGHAALSLDGCVLVNKRPELVNVTLEADRILRSRSP